MAPSTHPLRERLAAEGFGTGTWSEPSDTLATSIDDALAVFAEWLRGEAGDIEAEHSGEDGGHGPIVEHLRWLADSISPEATPNG